jgi:hypothetical protein
VTRGTRPKKPSSSRGFARETRGAWGAWGSWGLKTENRNYFFLLSRWQQLPQIYFILFLRPRPHAARRRKQQTASARTPYVRADATQRPSGCSLASVRTRFLPRPRDKCGRQRTSGR